MHPVIGHIGPLTLYSFGLMLAVAVTVCAFMLSRDAGKAGLKPEVIYDFVFWVILAGIAGSRIFFIFLNLPDFVADPKQIVMISNGGLAWQGGLLLGAAAGIIFVRVHKLPVGLIADLSSPYLALGQAVGRIGCFLNGCCYGRESNWGIYFPVHHARLYPTQLFDTFMLSAVFLILKYFQSKSRVRGEVFCLYLVLASLARFINEFFRGDHVNTPVGLSIFQLVSLGVIFAGIGSWMYLRRGPRSV